jgi:nickel/cobalt transporter (NiCoT) family protein
MQRDSSCLAHLPRTFERDRRVRARLDRCQLRSVVIMTCVVLGLHALGFFLLFVQLPHHHGSGASGGLAVGTGLTAYTLGLRHAFDADHICAIDNVTRKLMAEGKRPLSVGFFFSLGHSTIVFALALLFAAGVKGLGGQLRAGGSTLHGVTSWIGPGLSGTFLYIIAALNVVVLCGVIKLFGEMRTGRLDHAQLEQRLGARGPMGRFFGGFTRAVTKPWQTYPVGLLFGLGFDTATEVWLLILAAGAAGAGLPAYAVLCLPVLFAAGMSLLDTIDGAFMNFAYGWALSMPARKVFYNIAITGLSVAVALLIGTIELGGLLAQKLGAQGWFWSWLAHIDTGTLGFIVVGMFIATWAIAVAIWRFGRIDSRWRPRPVGREAAR